MYAEYSNNLSSEAGRSAPLWSWMTRDVCILPCYRSLG
jgi:hypothetical protein